MAATDRPISELDERFDALTMALTFVPDLPGLIEGIEAYADFLPRLSIDNPAAVDALSVAAVWSTLGAVAREVLTLKELNQDGHS